MNPMDFFNQKKDSGFPFNQAGTHFSPEYLNQIKTMVKQYNSVMTDDFWGDLNGLTGGYKKEKAIQMLPIEIWENKDSLYLSMIVPGLEGLKDAKLFFENDQVVILKINSPSYKPAGAEILLRSETPQQMYERQIKLGKPVKTTDYSSSYQGGILTYTFAKIQGSWNDQVNSQNELEIPFDF